MKKSHSFVMDSITILLRIEGYYNRGSAIISVDESNVNFDRHDESGDDYFWLPIDKEDMLSLREFLNKRFDDDGNVMPYGKDFSRKPKNFLWLLTATGLRPAFDYFDSIIVSAESEEAALAFRPENPMTNDNDHWPINPENIIIRCLGVSWSTGGTEFIQGSFNQS